MEYSTYEVDYLSNMLDFNNIAEALHKYKDDRQFYRFANKLFIMDRRTFYFFIKANISKFDENQIKILKGFYPEKDF